MEKHELIQAKQEEDTARALLEERIARLFPFLYNHKNQILSSNFAVASTCANSPRRPVEDNCWLLPNSNLTLTSAKKHLNREEVECGRILSAGTGQSSKSISVRKDIMVNDSMHDIQEISTGEPNALLHNSQIPIPAQQELQDMFSTGFGAHVNTSTRSRLPSNTPEHVHSQRVERIPFQDPVVHRTENATPPTVLIDTKRCASPPLGSVKRRRSCRNLNAIKLKKSSMFYRRLERLFFPSEESDLSDTSTDEESEGHCPEGKSTNVDTLLEPRTNDDGNSLCASTLPTLRLGPVQLRCVSVEPYIYVIDNFLKSIDLEYLDTKIQKSSFEKSFVDNNMEHKSQETSQRTSTFFSFEKGQDVRTVAIERRAADLLGCSPSQIEPLQLVRYFPGQFFGTHHDLGDLNDDGEVMLPKKSFFVKRRLVTLFCYLNDCARGGATHFEVPGIRVEPKRGRVVVFPNITGDGLPDPRTIHAGEPVLEGVKYGLNIWICEE